MRTSDGRVDGIDVNKPRNGMRFRAADISGAKQFGDTLMTPLRGSGLTLYSGISGPGN